MGCSIKASNESRWFTLDFIKIGFSLFCFKWKLSTVSNANLFAAAP